MTLGMLLVTAAPMARSSAPKQQAGVTNGRIVFQRVFFAKQTVALFTVDPDGTRLRQLTHPREGVATGQADWSPDGRKIAYRRSSSRSTGVHIFVMRADGTHRRDLSKGSCTPEVCQEEAPTWSPDGKHIAFHRVIGRAEPQIYVMRSDGSHRRPITSDASDWTPSWSPDGSHIVFERWWGSRNVSALFIVRADGTHLRRITPWWIDAGEYPDWSSNGRWILFQNHTSGSGPQRLCLIHPNGTGFHKITHGSEFAWAPGSFSPDGSMITALRDPGEASENDVYVMNLDGTGIQPVTASLSLHPAEGVPDWGPAR